MHILTKNKILIFIFFIILLFNSFYIMYFNNNIEHFTSNIRKWCRPHLRNARLISENFTKSTQLKTTNLFRKFGLY